MLLKLFKKDKCCQKYYYYDISLFLITFQYFNFYFLYHSSLPPGISCAFHHVCVVILANHLHKTYEPTQRGEYF